MKLSKLYKHTLKTLLGYKAEGIGLILTRRCNLSCPYCKIKDNSQDTASLELTLDKWQKIIDTFIKNKHQHFIFTGGEPLLYDNIFNLINYTSKKALTSLITNTSLLTEDTFKKLKNLDFLTFSIDTLEKDDTLQKNTSDKLKLISQNCQKYKINPAAIITVTKKNIKDIPTIIQSLTRNKIPALLSIIHSANDAKFEFRSYTPDLEFKTEDDFNELKKLQQTLLKMKKEKFLVAERKDFIINMSNFCQGTYQIKCPAANKFMTIDIDGKIKVCHDITASNLNALAITDYKEMKKELKKTVPTKCNCYYDCYFNSQYSLLNRLIHHAARI